MKIRNKFAAVSVPFFVMASQVHAAVPADVTTALTDLKADITTIGGLVLVVALVVAGFRWMRSAAH